MKQNNNGSFRRKEHTMITVTIGDITKSYEEATARWINDQISRRKRDGASICVKVTIKGDSIFEQSATEQKP